MWNKTSLDAMLDGLSDRTRPTEFEYGLMQAIVTASRSTCSRAKNGAVITSGGRVLMSGYNGALSGAKHCDHTCDCRADISRDRVHYIHCQSKRPCTLSVHAEANAIYWAARKGIRVEGADMFCTMSPCRQCAEAIIQAGIKQVYYLKSYRDAWGVHLLRDNGVVVYGYGTRLESATTTDVL